MLQQIEKQQAQTAGRLFEDAHLALVFDAVLEGAPGEIWVDDPQAPQTALMWDLAHCIYLAGDATPAAVSALCRQAAQHLLPEAQRRGIRVFKVYTSGAGWEGRVQEIFPTVDPARYERVFLTLGQPKIDGWRERVPPGFRIAPIERRLITDGLGNAGEMQEEILSGWGTLEHFFARGFGFCALHSGGPEGEGGEVIAGWCTAEYPSAGKCGIGIETVEAFMNRGLATAMASAFVEHCLAQGIAPHWDSWKQNLSSVKVAEKVGFRLAESYSVYFGRLPAE